jgi:hypothetical protein
VAPFFAFPAKAGIYFSRGHRLSPVKRGRPKGGSNLLVAT